MSWILTHSGKRFELLAPTAAMIDPMDIAHSLAHQCRFNGHYQRLLLGRAALLHRRRSGTGRAPTGRAAARRHRSLCRRPSAPAQATAAGLCRHRAARLAGHLRTVQP